MEGYLLDARLRARQLEDRMLVLLTRHGPLTVPELHRETFVLTARGDFAIGGRYVNAHNCTHAHLRRLLRVGLVERTDREGTLAWRAVGEGRRPEAGGTVHETTGPPTLDDVREEP